MGSGTDQGIEVSRGEAWPDGGRKYQIIVDGQHSGAVGNGGSLRVPTPPGTHDVHLRMGLAGSPKISIDVPPKEWVIIRCGPPLGWLGAWKTLQSLWRHDIYIQVEVAD
ncbi:MAG TPA: hypothetical protein VMO88_07495 [Acidimicrobiales bacterium]|nr:hypothetical protein [Acidimicrobiales bacterium]